MTDLNALQRALRASDEPRGLDVTMIIARGRGLRLRRRLAAAGGGLCVAAALAAVAAGAAHLARPALTPGPRPAAPGQSVPAAPLIHPGRGTRPPSSPRPARTGLPPCPSPWRARRHPHGQPDARRADGQPVRIAP